MSDQEQTGASEINGTVSNARGWDRAFSTTEIQFFLENGMDLVTAAEQEINRILAELEQHTDCVVESIRVEDIEITAIQDDRPKTLRRTKIELRRLPGHRWDLSK